MVCKAKINSLQFLRNKDLINDVNKILNEQAFDKMNEDLTRYAEAKYGLNTEGELLYSKKVVNQTDYARSRYWRDAKYTIVFAEPNDVLFNTLDELIKYNDSRDTTQLDKEPDQLYGTDADLKNLEFSNDTLAAVNAFISAIDVDLNLTTFEREDVLAAANFLNKTIDIAEDLDKRVKAWNKLPEEAAHWWYRLLNTDSELKDQLWKLAENSSKKEALKKVSYAGYVSEDTLTEESIGQLIAESIKRIEENKATEADKSFWARFIRFIKNIISKFKKEVTTPFDIAAAKILASDVSDLMTTAEYEALYNQASEQALLNNIADQVEQVTGAEVIAEVSPNYIDYLTNKKFKVQTRYLKKTIAKYKAAVEGFKNNVVDQFTNEKLKRQNITLEDVKLTFQSKIDLLKKFKQGIALGQPIKLDGVKKQELEILNIVREAIKSENPTLKSIPTEDYINEVENYINEMYKLQTRKLYAHLDYRVDATFTEDDGKTTPAVKPQHVKVGVHLNNEYFKGGGHFGYDPFAWYNLTPFNIDPVTKVPKSVLLHEIQTDFLDKLQKTKDDKALAEKFITSLVHKNDKYFSVFADAIAEKKPFSDNMYDMFKHRVFDELESEFLHAKNELGTGGFNKQIDAIEAEIDAQYKTIRALDNSLKRDRNLWEEFANEYFTTVSQLKKEHKNAVKQNDSAAIRKTRNDLQNAKVNIVIDFKNKLYDYLVKDYGFTDKNQFDVKNVIDAYINGTLSSKYNAPYYMRGLKRPNTVMEVINRSKARLKSLRLNKIKATSFVNRFEKIKDLTKEDVEAVYNNMLANQLHLENIVLDDFLDQNEESKVDFYKKFTDHYLTPVIHHSIQSFRANNGDVTDLRFSGARATLLTQGNSVTAELYAGPEEVEKDENLKREWLETALRKNGGLSDRFEIIADDGSVYESFNSQDNLDEFLENYEPNIKQLIDDNIYSIRTPEPKTYKELRAIYNNLKKNNGIYAAMRVYDDFLKESKGKFMEVGYMYTSMSKIKGIKLVYEATPGLKSRTSSYRVDLSNYGLSNPVLYGIDLSAQPAQEAEEVYEESTLMDQEEFDPKNAVEEIELDVSMMRDARAKEIVDVISERLALGLKVSYQNISPEEATEILKDRPVPYSGQPAFYHAGTIYTVGDNVSLETTLHEFAHPLLGALRRENNVLFNNLYNKLVATTEGEAIEKYVKRKYPELLEGSDLFKEEVLAHALQLKALNNINEQIATNGFDKFINIMLKAIKDMLKKVFGNKAVVSKLDVNTTIEELADMLLTKEFEYDTVMATKEDIVMYMKSVTEAAESLAKNASVKALQDGINRMYLVSDGIIQRAKNFKKGTPEYEMLVQSIFMDANKNKLLPEVKKSLAGFVDFGKTSTQSKDEIIDQALDAEQKRIKDLTNRATSFVHSLDVMNESTKYMFENILEIQKNIGFVSRPAIALLSMYKVNNRAMAETVVNLDKMFREDFGLGPGNPLYAIMSELTQNLVRNEELIKDVYKANTGKFYVEITGYMNDFLADELKTNLQKALGKKMTEPEIQMLYNKVIQQSLTDEDIEALSNIKGVNMRYINQFIDKYNYFVTNEDKILDILSGNTKDISIISRYLESYSTANDPVIGALAVWINDKKIEAEQEAIKKAHTLRVKLEKLLPKVNFNPNKTTQIFDMVAGEDEVFDIDKATGKPIRRTVGTLLSPHGNGWRHDKTELEYKLSEARESGDKKAIQKAQDELDAFVADYMWDKYLPEVYEKDKIFDEHPMGRQAWLDRKLIIEEMQSAISPVATELERFEKYSVMQALWKEYRQLYSLTYTDGSPKVDSPEDGVFDLTKAKILRKHREATRDYYEFVPIEGALQAAYNNFILQIQGQGLERDTDEFREKLAEWEKQNINRIYSDKYYEAVGQNIKRLKELQSKVNEAVGQTIDIGFMYEEIYNLMFAFKDEIGQPVPQELGEERLRKIRDIQQKIVDSKALFDNKSGLTKEELKELDFLKNAMRKQVALTDEQKIRYAKLDAKQQISGLTTSEIDEINDLYATLSDLRTTIPTDYYMEIMNTRLQEVNAAEIEPDKVDDFINSTEFAGILASNEEFAQWFYDNHVIRKVFDASLGKKGKYIDKFERSRAWSVTIPSNPDHYLKTKVIDKETGKEVEFIGVPNARHSVFRVKDKYRTIPIDADYSDYIGKVVDNKGDYLPRLYKPGDKYSAKTDKYMNKKYFALEAKKGAEWELLQAIKEYFLEVQKGKPGNSKLYLDIPRYSIKDRLEFIQTGLLQEKFDQFTGSLKYYFDRALGKAADDNENGFNYNADNNLINTDLNGTELGFVPVTGLYRLDFNVTSKDIFSSMFQYAMSIETQSKLIETLPLVQSIVETLEDPENAPKILRGWSKQYMKLTGEKRRASARNKASQRAGQLRSLFEREYYGRKVVGLEENNIILSKLLNGLQKLSATSSLALNPSSDLKNRYGAIAQNIVEAAGGEFVDLKSLALGRLWAAKAMLDWSTKGIYAKGPQSLSTQMIMAFDPVFKTQEQYGRSVSRSMAKDLLNGSFLYDFRKFAEMEGALQLFGGFMDKRMIDVKLSNGKTAQIKYVDAWELDQDGYLKLKDGIDPEWSNQPVYHIYLENESLDAIAKRYHTTVEAIRKKNKLEEDTEIQPGSELIIATSEKFKRFRNEFAGTSHLLYGAYDAFAQPEGDQYMLYRMFFFMRKWATPMFVNKWGADVDTSEGIAKMKVRERYNWEIGKTRMGYYTKTLQTLYELVRSKGDKYNYMTDSEKVALKKTFADTMQMIVYALIVGMLFGYDADDDERWEKIKARSGPYGTPEFKGYGFLANHTMLLLLGVQAETSAFLPLPKIGGVQFGLDDYSKFFTQTSTAFGNTVTLYAKILQDIFNTVTGDESALYKRDAGPYWFKQKGVNKIWSHLFKTVGFTGGTGDPETLLKNLEQSSSKIG